MREPIGKRKLVTADEAVPARGQHTSPCGDCPWARASLPGWLGGETAANWLAEAHGDLDIPCHVFSGAQCAGAAIYRTNVCKRSVNPGVLLLGADRVKVFATPTEFRDHHERRGTSPADTGAGDAGPTKGEAMATTTAKEAVKAAKEKGLKDVAAVREKLTKAAAAAEAKAAAKAAKAVAAAEAKAAKVEKALRADLRKAYAICDFVRAGLMDTTKDAAVQNGKAVGGLDRLAHVLSKYAGPA